MSETSEVLLTRTTGGAQLYLKGEGDDQHGWCFNLIIRPLHGAAWKWGFAPLAETAIFQRRCPPEEGWVLGTETQVTLPTGVLVQASPEDPETLVLEVPTGPGNNDDRDAFFVPRRTLADALTALTPERTLVVMEE